MPGLIYRILGKHKNHPVYPYALCPNCTGNIELFTLNPLEFRTGHMTCRCQMCSADSNRIFYTGALNYPDILMDTHELVSMLSRRKSELHQCGLELDITQGLTEKDLSCVREVVFSLNKVGYLEAVKKSEPAAMEYLRQRGREKSGPLELVDRLQLLLVSRLTANRISEAHGEKVT